MFSLGIAAALDEAEKARQILEVPVGAAVICEGEIISRAHNLKELNQDPTSHAEILAIRAASKIKGWRLSDCDIVSTLEPCPMCAGAIVQARVRRVVYLAQDFKSGAAGSVMNILQDPRLNHQVEINFFPNLEYQTMLSDFFRGLRVRCNHRGQTPLF